MTEVGRESSELPLAMELVDLCKDLIEVPAEREERMLGGLSRFAGTDLEIDEAVFEAEWRTGDRNRAIAYLMRTFGLHMFDGGAAASPVRRVYDGSVVRSKRRRSAAHGEVLREPGHRLRVAEVQGPLHFGAAEELSRSASVDVEADTTCRVLPVEALGRLELEVPGFAARMCRNLAVSLSGRLRDANHEVRALRA